MRLRKIAVSALLTGAALAMSAPSALAGNGLPSGWQDTYRDFDNANMCALAGTVEELRYPWREYDCFWNTSVNKWTLAHRQK
ncbi:hypothetical protein [Streptomyces zhihengii]|uniref:hypothetical protein n=1 Tax=Streptomyces zhihengii TaxID=1818004 RepID=UPI0033A9F884